MATKSRNVRVDDELWAEAMRIAADEGTTVSAEVVAFLRRYVRRHRRDS